MLVRGIFGHKQCKPLHFHKFYTICGMVLMTFKRKHVCSKYLLYILHCDLYLSACQYSFWYEVTFRAAKFHVDVKEGGGERGESHLSIQLTHRWPKRNMRVCMGEIEFET